MKIIPKTKKDLEWINYSPKQIKDFYKETKKNIEDKIKKIKSIKKEDRNFENTVFSIEMIWQDREDKPLTFLHSVSEDRKVRMASLELEEKISNLNIDIFSDKELYEAFIEYDPKKEKLRESEIRLWKDIKEIFEDQGLHLPKNKQERIKEINKKLSKLSTDFSNNLSEYHDFVLCAKEELSGLPENFIKNLDIDKKTGKYIVSLTYPEYGPFIGFSENEKKRKELIDKDSKKGGKENIKILKEMLSLRNELAKILGYKNFADLVAKDSISGSYRTIKEFIDSNVKKLKPAAHKDFQKVQKYIDKKYPGEKLNYYNSAYYSQKMKKDLFDFDQNEIREYFETNNVLEKMFSIFGKLFGVSFKENKNLPKWQKDVLIFDVSEKGKTIAHVAFDLYPRKDKHSHMSCFGLTQGYLKEYKGKEYGAPFTAIVGNFPKGTKNNPSLLSIGEVETMFHEFGHAMHNSLSRAEFMSQSGTEVVFDFVEVPSQLFENWVLDKKMLRNVSSHYKTGKKLSNKKLENIVKSFDFLKPSYFYRQFLYGLQDYEMHTDKFKVDPIKLNKQISDEYKFFDLPKGSLFPASWSHLTNYAARYYSYMWSLVYSYDIFSRFKKEGIMNKKTGKDLRKILESGDSKDPIKLVTEFLRRKPNNKAFLKEIGL